MRTAPADVPVASSDVEVVLLDESGVIVTVNEAWSRFAEENGGDPARTGVGMSYLDVCDAARDRQSEEVAAAIRAATAGDLPAPVHVLISCPAPGRPRYFDVLVSSRLGPSGGCIGSTVTLSEVESPGPTTASGAPDLRRTQTRLQVLARASAAVSGDLSLPVVLRHVVREARELAQARYAALGVVGSDGRLTDFVHEGMEPAQVERIGELPRGEGLLRVLTEDPRPLRLRSLHAHPARSGFPAHHPPMESFLGVPVSVDGQVFGNLYLTESAHGEFSREDEQLVLALAESAGVAIGSALRHARTVQRVRWLEVVTEMTEGVFAADADHPLETVLHHATRGADAELAVAVVPLDERRARVETVTRSGERRPGAEVALGPGLLGDVVRARRPALLTGHDDELAAVLPAALPREGVGSVAAVPLTTVDGDGADVLLVVRSRRAPCFVEHDLALLGDFAHHAGIALALDRARTDREAVLLMADHERIAADLHDHVIQELFATGMGLQGLVSRQTRPEDRRRILGHVDAIDATIRRIRSTIFQIRQSVTTGADLRDQLLVVLAEEQDALGEGVKLAFSGRLDRDVPSGLADDVVAVVREALSNTAQHAHASRAEVALDLRGAVLSLEVTDDGVGMVHAGPHSGLSNLRRRAERYGGVLELDTPPGGGTRLRWTAEVTG